MYFRVKVKEKKTSQHRQLKGFLLIISSFLLTYCFVLPIQSGVVGQMISNLFTSIFGIAAYFLPLIVFVFGLNFIRISTILHVRIDLISSIVIICSASAVITTAEAFFLSSAVFKYGGWMGARIYPFFFRLFGNMLSFILLMVVFILSSSILLRISLRHLTVILWTKLAEDYKLWRNGIAEMKKSVPPKIKINSVETQKENIKSVVSEPLIITHPVVKIQPKEQETKKVSIPQLNTAVHNVPYKLPPLDFLCPDKQIGSKQSTNEHLANAELLTKTLADFDITAKVKEIIPGPVVTRYDLELAPGIKIQSVVTLCDNISLAMRSASIRVVPIPEKSAVGIEVPNSSSCVVGLRGILSSPGFQNSTSLLTLALGKTTDGAAYSTNLAPMPHLLIAGATGSGKSVGIHSILLSILYKAHPDDVKFLLIDPKRVEMPIYRGLPHIYDPRVPAESAEIITQPKEAAEALKRLVKVMELRYEKYAKVMVRNIEGYNQKMVQSGQNKDFYIVVVIDELADLMLIASREVEDSIQRLAQMARAVGIHLILATQRPSVDVITGVIKANFPARIAFQTTSKVDSRVILDTTGADGLLGKGDMLFIPPGESRPTRLQGAFVSLQEAEKVVNFIKDQNYPNQYEDLFKKVEGMPDMSGADEYMQELFSALQLVLERKRVSQDLLKAHFGSSARATNLLSILETKGFIHKPEGTNRWTIYFDKIREYLTAMGQSATLKQE